MISKAKEASRDIGCAGIFIDHAALVEDDLDWLASTERLTLWNVVVPQGFLERLPKLWWVDWRGGSAHQRIAEIGQCKNLRYVALNQIRGLTDVDFLANLTSLEMLDLYGLSKVVCLPSMRSLAALRRVHLGQMKSLPSIGPLLEAPNLEELQLHNRVGVLSTDVEAMQQHHKLSAFEWYGENIPVKMWAPVRDAVGLPLTKPLHAEDWFELPA